MGRAGPGRRPEPIQGLQKWSRPRVMRAGARRGKGHPQERQSKAGLPDSGTRVRGFPRTEERGGRVRHKAQQARPLLLLLRPGGSSPQRGPGAAENALPKLCGDFGIETEVGSLRGCDCSWRSLRPSDYPGCKRPSMVAQEQRGRQEGTGERGGVVPRGQEVFHKDGVDKCPTLQKEDISIECPVAPGDV